MVTFEYSSNLATVTVEHVGRNGAKLTEGGITDVELDGYTVTGKATTIAAPALDSYVCVGAYTNSVQEGKLTQDVTLKAGKNTVKFVYEKIVESDVVFKLVDKDTNYTINYIKGAIGTTYAPAQANNALNLTSLHYKFVADTKATSPFNAENASLEVSNGMKGEYVVYYERETRTVTYKFKDVTNGEDNATEINDVTNGNETSARIGEKFKATAPVIDGYTVVGSATFNEVVEAGNGALEITFNYRQKDSKEVTVNHKVTDTNGEVLFTYTMSASVGEWVTAKSHDFGGKYTLTSDAEKKLRVTNGENIIEFFYAPNFVTVSAFTNTDGQNDQSYGTPVTAAKKTGETVKLNPPSLNGFVLKGIKVAEGATVTGGEALYPQGWNENTNTLTLTLSENSEDNIAVTYYYKAIEEVIPEYQATITIKAQYNGAPLAEDRTQIVTKGKDATVIPGTYAGYTVKQYKLGSDVAPTKDVQEAEKRTGITVKVDADTTLIFLYERTDNTVVVPGADGKIDGKDDIIVKPGKDNPDKTPEVDKDNNVKVPDGGTVILPDGTEVTPPGGVRCEHLIRHRLTGDIVGIEMHNGVILGVRRSLAEPLREQRQGLVRSVGHHIIADVGADRAFIALAVDIVVPCAKGLVGGSDHRVVCGVQDLSGLALLDDLHRDRALAAHQVIFDHEPAFRQGAGLGGIYLGRALVGVGRAVRTRKHDGAASP